MCRVPGTVIVVGVVTVAIPVTVLSSKAALTSADGDIPLVALAAAAF